MLGRSPGEARNVTRGSVGLHSSMGGTAGASRLHDASLPAAASGWHSAAARLAAKKEGSAEARAAAVDGTAAVDEEKGRHPPAARARKRGKRAVKARTTFRRLRLPGGAVVQISAPRLRKQAHSLNWTAQTRAAAPASLWQTLRVSDLPPPRIDPNAMASHRPQQGVSAACSLSLVRSVDAARARAIAVSGSSSTRCGHRSGL